MRIAIAGASGFVGQALTEALLRAGHTVLALTRSQRSPARDLPPELLSRLEPRRCDLFSLIDAERALEGADLAVYLVHSMLPSARLTQGDFASFDLIAADNFARAAKKHGVRQIVYLGGLLPEGVHLSRHLESRKEVERALAAHGVPLTTLRAGVVIGQGGSSLQLILRLVRRLPVMIAPSWTRTPTQPIALGDVVFLLEHCLGNAETFGQTYDIGGPEVMSYREMMLQSAEVLGVRRRILPAPFFSTRLSRLWVSVVTGAPKDLVAPLIESLCHPMVCRDRRLQEKVGRPGLTFREALRLATTAEASRSKGTPRAYRQMKGEAGEASEVRSVQRLPLPKGRSADWVSHEYMRWLPRWMRPFIRVTVSEERLCSFHLGPLRKPVLVLEFSPERSTPDRALFYIRRGLLAHPAQSERARLEFHEVLDGEEVLAAIHDFRPRLPWLVYTLTQALWHLWVMRGFARHLERLAKA